MKTNASSTIGLLYLLLSAIACVLMTEILARTGIGEVGQWITQHPRLFLLNLLFAFSFQSLFIGLMGRWLSGLVWGAAVLLLAAVVNALKLSALQTPFLSWDLFYARQMLALGQSLLAGSHLAWIGVFGLPPVLIVGAWHLHRHWSAVVGWKYRAALLIAAFCGLGVFAPISPVNLPRLLRVENIVWEQPQNYQVNGFFLAFSMNISPLRIKQPEAYDEGLITQLLEPNEALRETPLGYKGQPVSLVIVMSESFAELSGLPMRPSENPWKNLQRLAARHPSFRLISPTVAGNTSLVEFEALTGLSHALLPSGSIPYDHYLHRPVPSIASLLRDQGWRTIALHPFHGWFWNRTMAYEHLGFERYLSLDDFEDAEMRGFFVSDQALVDKIKTVIESGDSPYFLHAVSMQNHGPYNDERYMEDIVQVEGELPDNLLQALSTYLTGIRDADRQLARLLHYLKKRPEPVVCLFFGDHQPALGWELLPYQVEGALSTRESDFHMAEVPALLWSNKPDLLKAVDIPESFSPSHLPGILLQQMGIALPGHMLHMRKGMQAYPVIHRQFVRGVHGGLRDLKLIQSDPWFKGFEMLQYDVLFGNRYSTRRLRPTEIAPRPPLTPLKDHIKNRNG